MSYNSRHGLGSHAIAAAIIGEWLLQETSGTAAADRSGNAYSQALIGGSNISTLTVTGPNSWLPNGISLSGSGNYFYKDGPELTIEGTSHATISFWAKPGTTSGIQIGMYSGASGLDYKRFGIQQASGKIYLVAESGTGSASYPNISYSNTSSWVHVAAVYDGTLSGISRWKLYLNGALQTLTAGGADPHATLYTNLNAFCIGIFATYSYGNASYSGVTLSNDSLASGDIADEADGPELNYVSGSSLSDAGAFDLGTWALPSPFASGNNGSPSYEWVVVNAAGSVVDSGSGATSTGTADLSTEAGNVCYLLARVSNTGNYDLGDYATRTSGYGSSNDGYYELTSVTAASGGSGTDALTATGISTGAPSVGSPALGQIHALAATAVATGASSVGSPSVGQVHSLTAIAIATAAPSVSSPALGQVHALAATAVATGSPSVGTPAIGQIHTLAATGVATSAPSVGSPAIGQVHVLTATGITTGTPSASSPVLDAPGGTDALTATGIAAGSPSVGSPAVGQVHSLTATSVVTGAPSVGGPALGQLHALVAAAIATGTPSVGSPSLGQKHTLTATGVAAGAPSTGNPVITQVHVMLATGIATGAPTVGTPSLNRTTSRARRSLFANDLFPHSLIKA
jgi:hypothetical protein